MDEFCLDMPKIELHAHLNGSLNEKTLLKLGCKQENVEEYQRLQKIFQKTDRTLDECFELFDIAHKATNNPESVYIACTDVIQDFAEENVVYLELRTTPRAGEGMSKETYIETVVKAIKDSKCNVIVKLLLSINRKDDDKISEDALNLMIAMKEKYPDVIVGVDLSGNPNVGWFNRELFEKVKASGFFISIHCAEVKSNETLDILKFAPNRIGHGTCIHPSYGGSEEMWELYCDSKIPTELCLTSNVVCGTSKTYQEHHLKMWLEKKLPFCLGTDDKGVFSTCLTNEYYVASETFNLSKEDLWNISYNSIEFIFASENVKEHLRQLLKAWKVNNVS